MRNDIHHPEVEDLAMAITPYKSDTNEVSEWNVYLINLQEKELHNVIIVSEGYGEINGESKKTSVLRQHFEILDAKTGIKIESIFAEMLQLTNQYWISFYIGTTLYDKKYIFVPQSIHENNYTLIPILDEMGVMIR